MISENEHTFMEVTGVSSDVARFYLNAMGGKSERAINYFFSCNGTAHSTVQDGSTSPSFASGRKNIKKNSKSIVKILMSN